MGDVVPFQNKRRWTRPEDYLGNSEPPEDKPDRPPDNGGGGKRRMPWAWLFWLVAFVGVSIWVIEDPAMFEPPSWLATDPETIEGSFTRCDSGNGNFCVVDGDTFRLGERRIRIIGIDAPETHPARCDTEAKLGEQATAELQRLLNQGPFLMVGRIDEPMDKYGRELRALKRETTGGTTQSIAGELVASGTVRPYRGKFRAGWCESGPEA